MGARGRPAPWWGARLPSPHSLLGKHTTHKTAFTAGERCCEGPNETHHADGVGERITTDDCTCTLTRTKMKRIAMRIPHMHRDIERIRVVCSKQRQTKLILVLVWTRRAHRYPSSVFSQLITWRAAAAAAAEAAAPSSRASGTCGPESSRSSVCKGVLSRIVAPVGGEFGEPTIDDRDMPK